MSNEIRIFSGAQIGAAGRTTASTGMWLTRAPAASSSSPDADQVSLSRLYHALKSSEMAVRLHSLRLQVEQRSYLIPAAEISRGIIEEHLQAA